MTVINPNLLSGDSGGGVLNPGNMMPFVVEDAGSAEVPNAIDRLNGFLRGEISAAETYRMAIEKVANSADNDGSQNFGLLREIQEEHGRAAQALRDRIRELSGEPADGSGVWGVWAKTVQGIADLLGDNAALKSLKEGEEHGLKDYQDGLNAVDSVSADLIRNQFVPAQQRHINLLDQLIGSVSS